MNDNIWHTRAAGLLRKGSARVAALAVMALFFAITGTQAAVVQGEDAAETARQSLSFQNTAVYAGAVLDVPRETIQVKVYVDGENHEVSVPKGVTVEQALKVAGVELNPLDIVNLPLMRQVEERVQIDVERRLKVIQTEKVEIPFDTVQVETPLLSDGQVRVLSQGTPGQEISRYQRYIVDGVVIEETLLEQSVESQPVTQTEMIGVGGSSVSTLDFEWEFQNGAPVGYVSVLNGQRAAGYTANPGAKTSTGRDAMVGHVAVNPNVIPYGSKLYIQSADGQFVYGYAIAADTGGSLMNGVIDVDLFYDTYTEAVLNGMRSVDIYILEYPA